MFDVLSSGFRAAKNKLQGKTTLSEEDLQEALREVRTSLIQADVEIGVIRDFVTRVKEKCVGETVQIASKRAGHKVSAGDHFIKACYDELVALMGPEDACLSLEGNPAVIMMVGLQGSGKTTTAGKLAKKLMDDGKKPMLVAADIYRPAAIEQLTVLGRRLSVPVFSLPGADPVEIARSGLIQARNLGRDVLIVDTAGRLAVNNALMDEVVNIKDAVRADEVLFVCDAMMGQDAVKTAHEFDRRLDFTGFVLTKLDGDARGGAALAIKAVTGKPIKFLGKGEGLGDLEPFRAEGLAQRILGFGDVVGLMQDFEKHVDKESMEKDAGKMLSGDFNYRDFVKQLKTIRKMGPMREIMAKIPGLSGMMDQIPEEALDEKELDRTLAMISSMTKTERARPAVMNESRMTRIAKGCGRTVQDVRDLHERFLQAQKMMKNMGNMMKNPAAMNNMAGMMGQGGGMPGMGGMFGAPPEVKNNKRVVMQSKKSKKAAKKAKKKNRRR
jgi:signal recognition particle subunit SRP54